MLRLTKQLSQPSRSRPDMARGVGRNDCVTWSPQHTCGSAVTADASQTRRGGSVLEPCAGTQSALQAPSRAGSELVLAQWVLRKV